MIATQFVKASVALGCLCLALSAASAAERVSIKTKYYSVSGSTGLQLYASMVKRGPRQGFTSRAIAQTAYTVNWNAQVKSSGGTCRVASAVPQISITYTYPKPAGPVSPALQRRWSRFMVGVRKHEEKHGRLAREMVDVAVRSVRGLKMANDPSCRKLRADIKQRAHAIYDKYEARQQKFDEIEHRDGSNIDRLIGALVKP